MDLSENRAPHNSYALNGKSTGTTGWSKQRAPADFPLHQSTKKTHYELLTIMNLAVTRGLLLMFKRKGKSGKKKPMLAQKKYGINIWLFNIAMENHHFK